MPHVLAFRPRDSMCEDLKEATLLEYVRLGSFPAVGSELVLDSSPRYINEKGQVRDASASIEPTWRKLGAVSLLLQDNLQAMGCCVLV
jgi:hypothetical protein